MKKTVLAVLIATIILAAACSQMPKDYHPPTYRKIAIFAIYPGVESVEVSSFGGFLKDVALTLAEDLLEGNPHWDATSELALIATRCGYDVMLVAPDLYFDSRKREVEVQSEHIWDDFMPDNFQQYIRKSKSQVRGDMAPEAYLTGFVDLNDSDKKIRIEMRRWSNNKRIFQMDYDYFMKHYGEFFCGADVETY
ncbi:MAG TPA: hypothetical protein ENN07_03345 [candidate division Zixibacteria bacterium]|nr:hypothetical protein [candidate division Zixibacteria bacterium]